MMKKVYNDIVQESIKETMNHLQQTQRGREAVTTIRQLKKTMEFLTKEEQEGLMILLRTYREGILE
jgi:hypothetical protein